MSEHEQDHPASELARRDEVQGLAPLPIMSDGEIARSWRIAQSLARSRMFKDVTQAEQAFARIVMGRDLGLSTTQALSDLHIIEGKPVVGANTLAGFVRQLPAADYRVAWLKVVPPGQGEQPTIPPKVEAVWSDEEELDDLRETYGCVVEFLVGGERRGIARWTVADSERAGLLADRGSKKSNHVKFPRAMFFARCMSGGVRLHIPEATRGIPVYVEGEIVAERDELTAGEGEGHVQGSQLAPEVESVLSRAETIGHRGLADRAAAEMATMHQPENVVNAWLRRANTALMEMEPPPEAEVVPEPSSDEDAQEGDLSAEAATEQGTDPEPVGGVQAPQEDHEARESVPVRPRVDPATLDDRAQVAMDAALAAEEEGHPDAPRLMEEAHRLLAELEAAADPGQGSLDLGGDES